jgi:LysR family transcriptional activator of nhaA
LIVAGGGVSPERDAREYAMRWMNYHHLLYFWTVAREGTIARACEKLLVSQPTISGQLKALEQAVGRPLFDRSRRTLALTDIGQTVFR